MAGSKEGANGKASSAGFEFSTDCFYNGRVSVHQHQNGYRFSIDAILLAGVAVPEAGNRVMDVGTGCGIIPLLLAHDRKDLVIYGVEMQKPLADLAMQNVRDNHKEDTITIICEDIRRLKFDRIEKPLDLMVSNPPYRTVDSGRLNADNEKAVARHEITMALKDVVIAARRFLKVSGRLKVIYPADRLVDLICEMRMAGIEPKSLQVVYSDGASPAKLVIAEGVKGGGAEVKVLPPLYIYKADGTYTPAVEKMMAGDY